MFQFLLSTGTNITSEFFLGIGIENKFLSKYYRNYLTRQKIYWQERELVNWTQHTKLQSLPSIVVTKAEISEENIFELVHLDNSDAVVMWLKNCWFTSCSWSIFVRRGDSEASLSSVIYTSAQDKHSCGLFSCIPSSHYKPIVLLTYNGLLFGCFHWLCLLQSLCSDCNLLWK